MEKAFFGDCFSSIDIKVRQTQVARWIELLSDVVLPIRQVGEDIAFYKIILNTRYRVIESERWNKVHGKPREVELFERILVLIFACFEDFAAIAIIIAIKTWARSSDLKDSTEFRNKYLLGTLSSLVLALAVFLIYRL